MTTQTGPYLISATLLVLASLGILLLQTDVPTTITGAVVQESATTPTEPSKNQPINQQTAFETLLEADDVVTEIQTLNLSTLYLEDTLLLAQRFYIGENTGHLLKLLREETNPLHKQYLETLLQVAEETPPHAIEQQNYEQSIHHIELIKKAKEQIYIIRDTSTLLQTKINEYTKNDVDISEGEKLLTKAETSFKEERYEEALEYLRASETALDVASSETKRIKGLALLSKNFFQRYWWQLTIIILILLVIAKPVFFKIRKYRAEQQWEVLQRELQTLNKLLKKAQEDCFKHKVISQQTYTLRSQRYKEKITKIKHTLPVLEAVMKGEKIKKQQMEKRKGVIEIKR